MKGAASNMSTPLISVAIYMWWIPNLASLLLICVLDTFTQKHLKWKWSEVKWNESCSVMSNSLRPHVLYSPWNSPGQNTGVGSPSLLQGIFPTQELNPGLPHCRHILYQLSHKGSPIILEWVPYPFSSRSSQPRNWTGVSCIAGRFFTNWAIREAHLKRMLLLLLSRFSHVRLCATL